jgi:hypothetical protein
MIGIPKTKMPMPSPFMAYGSEEQQKIIPPVQFVWAEQIADIYDRVSESDSIQPAHRTHATVTLIDSIPDVFVRINPEQYLLGAFA